MASPDGLNTVFKRLAGTVGSRVKIADLPEVRNVQTQKFKEAVAAPVIGAAEIAMSPVLSALTYSPEAQAVIMPPKAMKSLKLKEYEEALKYTASKGRPIIPEDVFLDTGGWVDPTSGKLRVVDPTMLDALSGARFPSQADMVKRAYTEKTDYNLLQDILANPNITKSKYPELADITWSYPDMFSVLRGTTGQYLPTSRQVRSVLDKSTLAHETQHAIQAQYGDIAGDSVYAAVAAANADIAGNPRARKIYLDNPLEREARAAERILKQYEDHGAYTLPSYASSKGGKLEKGSRQSHGPIDRETQQVLDALSVGRERYLKATATDNWDELMAPFTPR